MSIKHLYGAIEVETDFSAKLNDAARRIAPFAKPGAVVYALTSVENSPAAAWYEIKSGDVYLDLSQLGVDIELVTGSYQHGREKDYDADMAVIYGVMLHELAHSRWTDWDPEEFASETTNTMVLFEEGRIERNVVNITGETGMQLLRTAFSKVLLPGFISNPTTTPYITAGNYALVTGRVHAGHIDAGEIIDVELATRGVLGDDVVDQLDEIIGQALQCRTSEPYELKQYAALADEWNALLKDEFGTAAEPVPVIAGEAAGDKSSDTTEAVVKDGDKDSAGGASKTPDKKSFDDAPDDTDTDGPDDAGAADGTPDEDAGGATGFGESPQTVSDGGGEWLEDMDAQRVLADALERLRDQTSLPLSKDRGRRSRPEEFADVFGTKTKRSGSNWKSRPPKPAERKAATLLTRLFEEMSTPAIVKRKASSQLPPGRLRGREAVRMAADRSAGRMSVAQPWRVEQRKHDTSPPITVGIATDTSGSMKWAEDMVASTAWIFATAGHRIGANIAAVTFGNNAEAVVRPREIPNEVHTRKANGGIEAFDDAMAALDGVLHLTNGKPGRKVLVIVSDGHFVRRHEPDKRRAWMQALEAAGVEVIWVNNDSWTLEHMIKDDGSNASVVTVTPGDYDAMVRTITNALNRR